MLDADFFPLSPANRRAVLETAEILRERGHVVFEVTIPNFTELVLNYTGLVGGDGLKFYKEALMGEPFMEEYAKIELSGTMPNFIRPLLQLITTRIGEKRLSQLIKSGGKKMASEIFENGMLQNKYKDEFHAFWLQNNLDAIIFPGLSTPSIGHGSAKDLFMSCCYTFILNVLGNPTGAITITRVREDEQTYTDLHNDDAFAKTARAQMKGSAGLPVGVQIIGPMWQDEKVLNIMKEIEEAKPFTDEPKMK